MRRALVCAWMFGACACACVCAHAFVFATDVVRFLDLCICGCMIACTLRKCAKPLSCVFSLSLCLVVLYGVASFFVSMMHFSQAPSLQSTGTSL